MNINLNSGQDSFVGEKTPLASSHRFSLQGVIVVFVCGLLFGAALAYFVLKEKSVQDVSKDLPSALSAPGVDNLGRRLSISELVFTPLTESEGSNFSYSVENLDPSFRPIPNAVLVTINKVTRYMLETPLNVSPYFVINDEGITAEAGKDVVAVSLTVENLSKYGDYFNEDIRLVVSGRPLAPFKVLPLTRTVDAYNIGSFTYLFKIDSGVGAARLLFGSSFEDPRKIIDVDFAHNSYGLIK